jgi:hypothetical protein
MTVLLMVIRLGTRKSWERQREQKLYCPTVYYRICMAARVAGMLSGGLNS